jgi:hypothetical protein
MKHIYTDDFIWIIGETLEDALENLFDEEGEDFEVGDLYQVDDNDNFCVMLQENDNEDIDTGTLVIPEIHRTIRLGEDDWVEEFCFEVYAKARDWAEVNSGVLCKEIN